MGIEVTGSRLGRTGTVFVCREPRLELVENLIDLVHSIPAQRGIEVQVIDIARRRLRGQPNQGLGVRGLRHRVVLRPPEDERGEIGGHQDPDDEEKDPDHDCASGVP